MLPDSEKQAHLNKPLKRSGGIAVKKNHEFGLDRMIFRFFENWGGKKLHVVKHVQKCRVFVVIFRGRND